MLRAVVNGISATTPNILHQADADANMFVDTFLNQIFTLASDAQKHSQMAESRAILSHSLAACISTGAVAMLLKLIMAFSELPDKKVAHPLTAVGMISIQMLALARDGSLMILNEAEVVGITRTRLHHALMNALECKDAPLAMNMFDVHVRAAMALAVLFGRDEAEDSDDEGGARNEDGVPASVHGALPSLSANPPLATNVKMVYRPPCTVLAFQQINTLENAIGSHACSLQVKQAGVWPMAFLSDVHSSYRLIL
jgi:hypothetical protein